MAKEVPSESLAITNTGRADYITHDLNNQPVVIGPGQTRTVEVPGNIAKLIKDRSDLGDTIKVGAHAERAKSDAEDRAQFEARQAKERAEFDREQDEKQLKEQRAVLDKKNEQRAELRMEKKDESKDDGDDKSKSKRSY